MTEQAVCQPEIPDAGRVLDNDENEWVSGYQEFFKRQRTVTFVDAITFDDTLSTYTSTKFLCGPYRKFSLLLNLVVALAPTDILIEIFESDDNSNFYKIMNGPFGDIRYEDAAGNKKESIQGEINAPYVRIVVTATGTDATNLFWLTAKMAFSS